MRPEMSYNDVHRLPLGSTPLTHPFAPAASKRTMRSTLCIIYRKSMSAFWKCCMCRDACVRFAQLGRGEGCRCTRPCGSITLHANFNGGRPRRGWETWGKREGGMDRVRKGEGGGERWCDDRAASIVFVHASAGKLIMRRPLTPLKC